jgi:hypothetical protein
MRQLLIAHEDYMRGNGRRHSINFYRRRQLYFTKRARTIE